MTTVSCPTGLDAIKRYYGDPDPDGDMVFDPDWIADHTTVYTLPMPLRLSWDFSSRSATRIRAHNYVGEAMLEALAEIRDYQGPEWLCEQDLDLFGGCYNPRLTRGGTKLSTHSWGIAIDLNPHRGPMGQSGDMPDFIVQAFTKRGFEWGGDWPMPYCDGMHFQACKGY